MASDGWSFRAMSHTGHQSKPSLAAALLDVVSRMMSSCLTRRPPSSPVPPHCPRQVDKGACTVASEPSLAYCHAQDGGASLHGDLPAT